MPGDLHPANPLVTDGQLSVVLDGGLLAIGDPPPPT
jgi:aminoglycoside phosphotransferase (APT) family kinase protein